MDGDQQLTLQAHVSIQKGSSFPPLQKCNNCCTPSQIHCPFCSPVFFKPTKHYRIMVHLEIHLRKAIYVGEYTIHRCGLQCRKQQHYHCLYCTATLIRKKDFTKHLSLCRQAQQRRAQKLSQLQTVTKNRVQVEGLNAPSLTSGESDILSYGIESDDDSDSEIPNSNGQEASGSQLVIKCHQTVQTDVEKPQDCDEHYFMSLMKVFKRLSPQKKADVRMKIERLLFEAEFE